jgi:hypothetical protein
MNLQVAMIAGLWIVLVVNPASKVDDDYQD